MCGTTWATRASLATSFWSLSSDQTARCLPVPACAKLSRTNPSLFYAEWKLNSNTCVQLRYANHSNYKNDTMIRKEANVAPAVLKELKRIIVDSEVCLLYLQGLFPGAA